MAGDLCWFRLTFGGGDGVTPRPDHVHAAVAGLVEEAGGAAHQSSRKPYTVGLFEADARGVSIDVTTLTERAADNLVQRLAESGGVRLGSNSHPLHRLELVEELYWHDLLDASVPAEEIALECLTPTVFRDGQSTTVLPTPGLIFGHLRAVWSHWAPADLRPDLDLASLRIHVPRLWAETQAWLARRSEWHGFVGEVTFDLSKASERERRVLHALALATPFLGMGANTTTGMGVCRVL